MLLNCIADDFTGATDLANMLVRAGMRTVQTIGVPDAVGVDGDPDAVVVALKSRTTPAADSVERSLAALAWLKRGGARQFYFKYCSTFDSTDEGNIGPVADALLDALGSHFTIACPAFPANGRTIFPKELSGRPAHRPFRGLLSVHSRYGPHTRAATDSWHTYPKAFSHFVTSMTAPVASGWSIRRVGFTPTGKRRLITAAHPEQSSSRFSSRRSTGFGYVLTQAAKCLQRSRSSAFAARVS